MTSEEFAELEDKLEGWERDALRYRWLREQKASGGGYWVAHGRINGGLSQWYGEPLDKAIDAAMTPNAMCTPNGV